MPVSRIVFQRGTDNWATIPVQGNCPSGTTAVEARATPINGGQLVNWTPIAGSSSGAFAGTLNLSAGWYQLDVRSLNGGIQTGYWSVDRIGVGEVLIVAGQSNAQGTPDGPDAQDDRVSCVAVVNGAIREYELSFQFQHLDGGAGVGPTSNKHFYGALGTKLVQRLNVPVLLLGAGLQATSSEQWARSAQGNLPGTDTQEWDGQEDLRPYRALGAALNHYARRTGLRGVLWFQGESDKGKSGDAYFGNIEQVINKSRADIGYTIPWVISQTSWIDGGGDASITDAQRRLVGSVAACYAGPNTDAYGNEYRNPDGTHFGVSQMDLLASLWNESLSESFWQNAQPFRPNGPPATVTTGLPAPARQYGGGHLYVSYMKSGPSAGATYSVQLLSESGSYLTTLGSGTTNPLLVYLPDDANGTYRVQVVSSAPGNVSTPSEKFWAFQNGLGKGTGTGLTGTYYPNPDLAGAPVITRVDSPLDLTWINQVGSGMPADNRNWSARWTGQLEAPRTGTYTIKALNDDGSRVWVNDQMLIDDWQVHPWAVPQYGQIYMEAGHRYAIKIELYQAWFAASVKLLWLLPGESQSQYVPTDRLYPGNDPTSPTPPTNPTPPVSGGLVLVAPAYNCSTGAITFQATGGNGSPIEYAAAGITGWTTNPNQYLDSDARTAVDTPPFSLSARQSGVVVTYTWSRQAACSGNPPPPPTTPPTNPPLPTNPSPSGGLTLVAPLYSCSTGAITFQATGGNGSPIEYAAAGITGWTTNPNQYLDSDARTAGDTPPFSLSARQSGVVVTYTWSRQSACSSSSRQAASQAFAELTSDWSIYPNPVDERGVVTLRVPQQYDPATLRLSLIGLVGKSIDLSNQLRRLPHAIEIRFTKSTLPPGLSLLRVDGVHHLVTLPLLSH